MSKSKRYRKSSRTKARLRARREAARSAPAPQPPSESQGGKTYLVRGRIGDAADHEDCELCRALEAQGLDPAFSMVEIGSPDAPPAEALLAPFAQGDARTILWSPTGLSGGDLLEQLRASLSPALVAFMDRIVAEVEPGSQ